MFSFSAKKNIAPECVPKKLTFLGVFFLLLKRVPEFSLSNQEGATGQRNTHGIFAQAAATASLNHPMQRVVLVVPGTMAGTKVVIRFSQVLRNLRVSPPNVIRSIRPHYGMMVGFIIP